MASFACEPAEMLGKVIQVETKHFRVLKTIAEGGNGHIFSVENRNGKRFAMKRVVVSRHQDPAVMKSAQNECVVMRKLEKCSNILSLIAYEVKQAKDLHILLLVMKMCDASLFDIMNRHQKGSLSEQTIYKILYDTARGLYQMHSNDPPIAHRDIKVENVLWNKQAQTFQLCDFGSTTTTAEVWREKSRRERNEALDDITRNTTLNYRSPEQCDLDFHSYRVDERVDLWALGVLMYQLLFYKTPFADGSKLGIMNGDYKFPDSAPEKPKVIIKLIKKLLSKNPSKRPTAVQVLKRIVEATSFSKPPDVPEALWNSSVESRPKKKKKKKEKKKSAGAAHAASESVEAFDAFFGNAGQTTAAAGTGQDAFNFATSSNDVGGPVETQESLFEQQVTFPQDSNDDFFNAFGGTTEAQSNRKGTTGAAFDAFAGDTPTASSNSTAGIGDSFAWAGSQTDVKADSEDVNTFFGQPFSEDKQQGVPRDSNRDLLDVFGGLTEAQSNGKGTTGAAFDAFAGDTPTASSNSAAGIGDSFAWAGSQTDVKADSEDVNTFFGQPFSDDKQESGVDDIDALFGNVAIQGHGQNAKSDFDPFSQTVDFNAVPSQKPAAPTAPSMEDIFGIDENVADADVWGSLT
jgi:AP2-associated kinase